MQFDFYPMQKHYILNALGWKNSVIRFLTSIILTAIFFMLGSIPLNVVYAGNEMIRLLFMLLPFATGLGGLLLSVYWIHQARATDLVMPHDMDRIDFGRLFFGFGLWLAIQVLMEMVLYIKDPGNYLVGLTSVYSWAILLLVAIVFVPVQTSFEELLIRSYMFQQFYVIFRCPWAVLFITSVLFATLHFRNPETVQYGFGIMFGYYMLAGVIMGLISLLDGRMELGMGFHAANNIFASVLVSYKSSAFSTSTLIVVKELNVYFSFLLFILGSLLFIVLASVKYGLFSKCKSNL